jgi:hypothetical protein
MIAEISFSVFASEIADGLAAAGHDFGLARASVLAAETIAGLGGVATETQPTKTKASSAPVRFNRIKSTPEFIVNVIIAEWQLPHRKSSLIVWR